MKVAGMDPDDLDRLAKHIARIQQSFATSGIQAALDQFSKSLRGSDQALGAVRAAMAAVDTQSSALAQMSGIFSSPAMQEALRAARTEYLRSLGSVSSELVAFRVSEAVRSINASLPTFGDAFAGIALEAPSLPLEDALAIAEDGGANTRSDCDEALEEEAKQLDAQLLAVAWLVVWSFSLYAQAKGWQWAWLASVLVQIESVSGRIHTAFPRIQPPPDDSEA